MPAVQFRLELWAIQMESTWSAKFFFDGPFIWRDKLRMLNSPSRA